MLNPLWNTRKDEYGGSLDNRMRFMIETLEAMRSAVGKDMPLGVRLKLDDMAQRGMSQAEYVECVKKLETLGLVDYLNVTGGDGRFHHGPMPRPEGEWLPLVKNLRGGTKLTLMHAGRIATPEMAEKALADGVLDVVCMTKTHICDPHFARKVFEDRLDDIRYCTRCLQACHGHMETMTCVYNPVTSREREWAELKRAANKKRIIVIGAGPAGMEAALVASQRGHEVIVLEKSDRVGGQVLVGAASPLRRNWMRIAEFYDRQSRKGLFEVRFGTDANLESILALKPDAVVVATGSRPNRLDIANGPAAMTVHEVIAGKADAAKNVVLFDREGFNRPLVAADYLSSRGINVQFVTSLPQVCAAVEGMMLEEMIAQLRGRGVNFSAGEEIEGWNKDRVLRLRLMQTNGERVIQDVDVVVATIGSTSVSDLQRELKDKVPELHVIGDASSPQTVENATYMGGHVGRLV
jgi:thioredoxin reductase